MMYTRQSALRPHLGLLCGRCFLQVLFTASLAVTLITTLSQQKQGQSGQQQAPASEVCTQVFAGGTVPCHYLLWLMMQHKRQQHKPCRYQAVRPSQRSWPSKAAVNQTHPTFVVRADVFIVVLVVVVVHWLRFWCLVLSLELSYALPLCVICLGL